VKNLEAEVGIGRLDRRFGAKMAHFPLLLKRNGTNWRLLARTGLLTLLLTVARGPDGLNNLETRSLYGEETRALYRLMSGKQNVFVGFRQ